MISPKTEIMKTMEHNENGYYIKPKAVYKWFVGSDGHHENLW